MAKSTSLVCESGTAIWCAYGGASADVHPGGASTIFPRGWFAEWIQIHAQDAASHSPASCLDGSQVAATASHCCDYLYPVGQSLLSAAIFTLRCTDGRLLNVLSLSLLGSIQT